MPAAYVYGGGRPVATSFTGLSPFQRRATDRLPAAPVGSLVGAGRSPGLYGSTPMPMPAVAAAPAAAPSATGFFDPNQPFANAPDLQGGIRSLLAGGGKAFGPDYLRNLLRQRALMTAHNQRRRGDILSRLSGLDPMAQRQAMMDFERQSGSDLSRSLGEADLAGGQNWQQFLMDLLRGERGGEMQTLNQQAQNRFDASQRPNFLGQLVGAGTGIASSFVGRPRTP